MVLSTSGARCDAYLEAAVNDVAVRAGKKPAEAIEKDLFTEYPPKKRIRLVSRDSFDTVYEHYADLCKVVHELSTISSQGPLHALTRRFGFVEAIYHQNSALIQERQKANPKFVEHARCGVLARLYSSGLADERGWNERWSAAGARVTGQAVFFILVKLGKYEQQRSPDLFGAHEYQLAAA